MKVAPVVLLALIGAAVFLIQRANAAASTGFRMTAANPTATSAAGIAFIKRREGFSAKAYPDGVDAKGRQLYSIGYGHRIVAGDGLTPQSIISEAQASTIFLRDLASREALIRNSVRKPINQAMFDALVSLAYNIGNAAFTASTLLRLLNAGDYVGARNQFYEWDKRDTQNVERRKMEAAVFGGGAYA